MRLKACMGDLILRVPKAGLGSFLPGTLLSAAGGRRVWPCPYRFSSIGAELPDLPAMAENSARTLLRFLMRRTVKR